MNPITIYNLDARYTPLPSPRNCPSWLRRIIYKIIDYLLEFDARIEARTVVATRIYVEVKELSEFIYKEWRRVYDITGKEPRLLFMGRNEWDELGYEMCQKNPFSFNFNPDIHVKGSRMFHNMRVVVVPWISGMFCLPDLDTF